MRFLCLWACKSGSLEDFTNTLKAEALFLVFWFKALSSFLLPLVTTINDLSFYFLARLQTFSNLVCVWGGTTCTCVLVCMHVHIHGGQRNLELCCQPAKSRNPLVPISTHCAGVIGKHVAVDVEDSNSGLAHSMISPGPIFKTFCSDNFCAWFTL